MLCFLISVLVISLCSLCENSSNCTLKIYMYVNSSTLKLLFKKRCISQATHATGIKYPVTFETNLTSTDWRAEEKCGGCCVIWIASALLTKT